MLKYVMNWKDLESMKEKPLPGLNSSLMPDLRSDCELGAITNPIALSGMELRAFESMATVWLSSSLLTTPYFMKSNQTSTLDLSFFMRLMNSGVNICWSKSKLDLFPLLPHFSDDALNNQQVEKGSPSKYKFDMT